MNISASVPIGPTDDRCSYWAKIVRSGTPLPLPSQVRGAGDLPGPYVRRGGDEELFVGDVLFEGEALHHKRNLGWAYWFSVAGSDGKPVVLKYSSAVKARLKELGLETKFLPGAGDLAGVVRVVHGLRAGLCPYNEATNARISAFATGIPIAGSVITHPPTGA